MTNADLARIVRLPGKIEMPVVAANDVFHIIIEKADLLDILDRAPGDRAQWAVALTHPSGVRRLDVREDGK